MGRRWILETDTKGTGARVVPLEDARRDATSVREPAFVMPPRRSQSPAQPRVRRPPRFRVVDVRSGRVLAQGTDTRATVEALEHVGSVIDVHVFRWDHEGRRWRLLTHGEQAALWRFRGR